MATMTTPELLDVFKNMTVLELNDFLKAFEEEFGVTAAAPVAVAAAPAAGGGGGEAAAAEEKDEFDVILTPRATRRSRSSRRSGRSSRASASRRPRTWSTAPPSRCWRRSPRKTPRRRRRSWKRPAPPSSSSRSDARRRRRYVLACGARSSRNRFHSSNAVAASIAATARRSRPARVDQRVGQPVGDRGAEALLRDRAGPGQPAQPADGPSQRDLLRRVGGPDPLERLGVGLAVGAGALDPHLVHRHRRRGRC